MLSFFFFSSRRRHTRSLRDWSSDVCSSDLHRDKKRGTARSLALIREVGFPEERVLIDHNTEETLPLVLDTGCWAGHSIYPHTKMDEARMVALVKRYGSARILVNSAADWGVSDPLKVPKTVALLDESGIAANDIETIVWKN